MDRQYSRLLKPERSHQVMWAALSFFLNQILFVFPESIILIGKTIVLTLLKKVEVIGQLPYKLIP